MDATDLRQHSLPNVHCQMVVTFPPGLNQEVYQENGVKVKLSSFICNWRGLFSLKTANTESTVAFLVESRINTAAYLINTENAQFMKSKLGRFL